MSDRERDAPLVLVSPTLKPNTRVIYKEDPSCEYFTPAHLRLVVLDILDGRPDLDPATTDANPMGAAIYYTQRVDALSFIWWRKHRFTTVFSNPPYGRKIRQWIKMFIAAAAQGATVLVLVPCRPGSIWYRMATRNAQLVCEIHGRVTYELPDGTPAKGGARWASCFLYWGPDRQRIARKLRDVGEVRMCRRLPKSAPAPEPIDPRQLRLVKP